ncbi:MAG: hypothetical protein JXR37_13170 [Kiritimatiellae bacterium]|nr:hypothetical protein [Kiritimatiellia bacterium]
MRVAFRTTAAAGPGCEGCARHYALEQKAGVVDGLWSSVPGYTDIVGTGQTVRYTCPADGGERFYRVRVWLQGL